MGEERRSGGATTGTTVLSGVDALVQLLWVRRRVDERDGLTTGTMVSGYPGSPLAGFDLRLEQLAAEAEAAGIVHRPGLNEELALAAVWGSQMGAVVPYRDGVDGVAGAWYGKAPGLDRSGDALKHANALGAGPHGGAVLFCGDDPTAKSSTLTCDSQHTFEDACVPVLYPGDQQEVVDLGVHAFRLSRYAGCWAGMKVVTAVADGIGSVDLGTDRHRPSDPDHRSVDGRPWRHEPLTRIGPHTVQDQEALVVDQRLRAAQAYVRHNGLDRVVGAGPGAPLGIVCAGKTYYDVVSALAGLGLALDDLAGAGVRILKLAMTWPVVPETVVEFAASVDEVLVVEEKRPFVEGQVRSLLHEAGGTTPVRGKRDRAGASLVPVVGELDAAAVATVLTRVRPELAPAQPAPVAPSGERRRIPVLAVPPRPPGFCSGCPHNRSTVFPAGALVGGGVGCHGIMYFEARHTGMTALPPTPMGAEGVPWIGLAPFVDEPHLIQNLGDGTLSHSGTLAIRASVAAGVDVTFKVLYNAAVAMTGGQDVTGLADVPSLTRALEAEGVRRVVVCADDPHRYPRGARWAAGVEVVDRDRLPAVQDALAAEPGVTVIVYDQQCAAEARRLRKRGEQVEPPRRVVINEAVCEGCGDCSVKSNCLSVLPLDTELGERRQIHQLSCNKDYSCLDGDCPSFVTLEPVARGRRRAAAGPAATGRDTSPPPGELPVPAVAAVDGVFGVYFTGIGGTGVITANRVLAAAAEEAGLVVGGMDQTGLSQKAGAVVSHLQLAEDATSLGAHQVGAGGADLYLSGDILQAAGPLHLAKVAPGRTVAVVDRDVTPTAAMLQSDLDAPAAADLEAAVSEVAGEDRVAFVDSTRLAEAVFDNHLLANVVLLGAAFQLGGLPFSAEHLDAALARQGRAAAANRAAFEWGRWAVHDPAAVAARLDAAEADDHAGAGAASIFDPSAAAVAAAAPLVEARSLPSPQRDLLARRAAQVVDYQSPALAERFLALVERAAAVDDAAHDWALTRAVAEAWFRLLTYKDEYEVARLHRKVDLDHLAHDLGIEGPYQATYHLHPPFLRRLGREEKLPLGRTYEIGFAVLARLKRLRGTRADVFGWDRDRRMERAVIEEYAALMDDVLAPDADLAYEDRVALADSAHTVRGYGPVKEASVTRWREQVAALRARTVVAAPTP
ncbi:MAG: indolepyruvate ferredoxin oxidoreductase family protein [Acidimicrobiales bacterium]|nr:indolepyruvate ferredoxin oxidoreductase family protein [Acidimicrobiales bacterium]